MCRNWVQNKKMCAYQDSVRRRLADWCKSAHNSSKSVHDLPDARIMLVHTLPQMKRAPTQLLAPAAEVTRMMAPAAARRL